MSGSELEDPAGQGRPARLAEQEGPELVTDADVASAAAGVPAADAGSLSATALDEVAFITQVTYEPVSEADSPYSKDDEVVIDCWPYAEMERKADDQTRRHYWLLKTTVPVFMLLWLIFLINSIGMATGGWANFLQIIVQAGGFGVVCLLMVGRQPTYMKVNPAYVRLEWVVAGETKKSQLITWSALRKIELRSGFRHRFIYFKGPHGKDLAHVQLDTMGTRENWRAFVTAVRKCQRQPIEIDDAIEEALSPDMKSQTYTEIWLDALSAAPRRERLQPLIEGTVLRSGQYEVWRQIGAGGQGTAYLARRQGQWLPLQSGMAANEPGSAGNAAAPGEDGHAVGPNLVVLKEYLLPVFVDIKARRQALSKFEQEAEVLRSLDHPSIVKLIDHFVEDHRAYLVLEYVDGSSVRKLVEEKGPLPEEAVISLAPSICDILTHLHSQCPPVIHRDFTPDNLLLASTGRVKLIDFMVAQRGDNSSTSTVVGKHAYLPPEQFRGHATTCSDIYALGACLYFMLTAEDPEPLSQSHPQIKCPQVSSQLDAIVAKATAFDQNLRFGSAQEMKEDLTSLLHAQS